MPPLILWTGRRFYFEMNGQAVNHPDSETALRKASFEGVRNQIESQLSELRVPDTGGCPTITGGEDLEHLSGDVNGSKKLITLAKERLGIFTDLRFQETLKSGEEVLMRSPRAFICHASENKPLARQIAEDLMKNGIDTFFDEWEIGAGDSIRQKIDVGLANCTHFMVLLTPQSLPKPWVNSEIDAGFLRKLEGNCEFIPIRYEMSVDSLPPLLRTMFSPALTDYENNLKALVAHVHGARKKPAIGPVPKIIAQSSKGLTGLSPAAEAIVRYAVEHSEHGSSSDPQFSPQLVRDITGLTDDDIVEAVDELKTRGFVKLLRSLDSGPIGFAAMASMPNLFAEFDQHFKDWNPEADARRIAADLVNELDGAVVSVLAQRYGWPARRINPAVSYLERRGLVQASSTIDPPWVRYSIRKNPRTRRFVESN